jgi:hypothetical protein
MLPPTLTSEIELANHVLAFAIALMGFLALLRKSKSAISAKNKWPASVVNDTCLAFAFLVSLQIDRTRT